MPENMTEQDFRDNLNTKFRVLLDAPRPVELELVEVKSYEPKPNEQPGMERFALYFNGPGDIYLPQYNYPLEHDKMGQLVVFIVPIGHDERGFRYEAVFNNMGRRR
jgi:hypothetical protein